MLSISSKTFLWGSVLRSSKLKMHERLLLIKAALNHTSSPILFIGFHSSVVYVSLGSEVCSRVDVLSLSLQFFFSCQLPLKLKVRNILSTKETWALDWGILLPVYSILMSYYTTNPRATWVHFKFCTLLLLQVITSLEKKNYYTLIILWISCQQRAARLDTESDAHNLLFLPTVI